MVLVGHYGRRCVASLCLLATLLCLPSLALAQAAAPPPPPPLREGSVDFSLLVTTGNASTNTVGLGGNIIYRPGPWVIENRAGSHGGHGEIRLGGRQARDCKRAACHVKEPIRAPRVSV